MAKSTKVTKKNKLSYFSNIKKYDIMRLYYKTEVRIMDKNLSDQLTDYISEAGTEVKANKIYDIFIKKGFTDGQIAGALRRLKNKGKVVSPRRGFYENTNSLNVLDELKRDINILIDKYNSSVPITIFTELADLDKEEYTNIITTLNDLI